MDITLESIKSDKVSSSYQMGRNSLELIKKVMKESGEINLKKFAEKISNIGNELIKSQPNIVVTRKNVTYIIYYLNRMVKANKPLDFIKKQLEIKIREITDNQLEKKNKIANFGAKLIFNNNNILTISFSSIVKDIFIAARKLKRKFNVYCLESRPLNEGIHFAEDLIKNSIKCNIVTDASMGTIMKDMNMVICGADRLYETGFVNKIGTLPLAVTAKYFSIPFYLACETDKIMKEIDRSLRFYRQNPGEVYHNQRGKLEVINYHFEAIPYSFVSKIICEDGVFETNEYINWYIKE
jgi:translation initiation factor 2B subunit (eIF-2B alpha/beta/delta family)